MLSVCMRVGEESGRCIPQYMSCSSAPGIMKTFEGKEKTCFYSQGLSLIRSQIQYSSGSYVIALKSSVSRRKAVNTEWSTMEGDGR